MAEVQPGRTRQVVGYQFVCDECGAAGPAPVPLERADAQRDLHNRERHGEVSEGPVVTAPRPTTPSDAQSDLVAYGGKSFVRPRPNWPEGTP